MQEGNETFDHGVLTNQLYCPHYLRLWRTGTAEHCYRAEEDTHFDPESLGIQEGEFAISRDLLVDVWLKFREYNGELQLKEVMGGDFVVLTEYLWDELDEFRKNSSSLDCYAVEDVELVRYWHTSKAVDILKN